MLCHVYIHTQILACKHKHRYIHYITLHYLTLRYITLHYITFQYIHYIHYVHALRTYIAVITYIHYITLHYIAVLTYLALHCITLHYIALHSIVETTASLTFSLEHLSLLCNFSTLHCSPSHVNYKARSRHKRIYKCKGVKPGQ